MFGQSLPIEAPVLHLRVKVGQAAESHGGTSRQGHLALGLVGLMLMGVAVWGVLARDPHADSLSKPRRHVPSVAFAPGAIPVFKPAGFLPVSRQGGFRPAMEVAPKVMAPRATLKAMADSSGETPAYKLTYFDIRGLAETARLMFAAAKQEYTDERFPISKPDILPNGKPDFRSIKRPEFDAAKAAGRLDASNGKAPLLTVDGATIGQSKAIERYLAKQLGLAGSNDIEAAQIDAVSETVRDIKDAYQKVKDDDTTKEKFLKEDLNAALVLLEKSLPKSSGPWLVGSTISYADIVVFQLLTDQGGAFDDSAKVKAAYSSVARVNAAMEATGSNTEISEWIANRPVGLYLFDNI